MSDFQYQSAPITEAVVQFRTATTPSKKDTKKGITKLSKNYAEYTPQEQQKVAFAISQLGEPTTKTKKIIVDKLSSSDMTKQLIIRENSFVISQHAPYCGWKEFEKRILRDWKLWKNTVGFQEIKSVGMRYINRIDIPVEENLAHYENYVTVYPNLPQLLDPSIHHSVNIRVKFADIESELILNSALVPSPIPEHVAITVDIDLIRAFQSSPSDTELSSALNAARLKKNEVFESCITSQARERFNQ